MARKNIDQLIEEINSKFGDKVLFRGNELKWDRFDTGLFSLNYLLGGGLPRGAIVEFRGLPSTFKTTTALYIAGQLQQQRSDAVILWAVTENPPSAAWGRHLGAKIPFTDQEIEVLKRQISDRKIIKSIIDYHDSGKFYFVQAATGDLTLEAVYQTAAKIPVDLIIVDSIVAVTTVQEQSKGVEDKMILDVPHAINRFLKKMTAHFNASMMRGIKPPAMILINQERQKFGTMQMMVTYDTPGGLGLKHFKTYSIRFQVTGRVTEKSQRKVYAEELRMTVEKAKLSRPFVKAQTRFILTEDNPINRPVGFDLIFDSVNLAKDLGLLNYKPGRGWLIKDNIIAKKAEELDFLNEEAFDVVKKELNSYLKYIDTGVVHELKKENAPSKGEGGSKHKG